MSFFIRHEGILPTEKRGKSIAVIGAGAIGSQVVLCLAKMGFEKIKVYDYDSVSEENIANQWYGPHDVGRLKVEALMEYVEKMTGTLIEIHPEKVGKKTPHHPLNAEIVIPAVDNMSAREDILDLALQDASCLYLIDPRMSAEEGSVEYVNIESMLDITRYKKSFFPDNEGVSEPCTAKATMYCSMLLAGFVSKLVKDICVDEITVKKALWDVRKNDLVIFKDTKLAD